ncbi:hypothetical protein R9X47_21875 [Wukongibacter baidiensis]|uniref:hypothetical protein n=1 Tax=Wukongibacter baidiensis TaxID=1723361 RepID=UPI003D7F7362
MSEKCTKQIFQCGEIFDPTLPNQLTRQEPPIKLATLHVQKQNNVKTNVEVNLSCTVDTIFCEPETLVRLIFRLLRVNNRTTEILETWEWSTSIIAVISEDAAESSGFSLSTENREPLVINFCDELDPYKKGCFTYIFQLIEVTTLPGSYYDISDKRFVSTTLEL